MYRLRQRRTHGAPNPTTCEPLEPRRLLSVDLLANIHAGATAPSFPSGYAEAGGRAWFIAEDESARTHHYKTDGTAAGTVAVGPALRRGAAGPVLWTDGPTAAGDAVLYEVSTGTGTWRLMAARADDAGPGTELLRAGANTNFSLVAPAFGGAVFSFGDGSSTQQEHLYYTDGTLDGTRRLADVMAIGDAAQLGGFVYFVGTQGFGTGALWRTDGTAAGTTRIIGASSTLRSDVVAFRGRVYFMRSDIDAGSRQGGLWATDGTPAGTYRVGDASSRNAFVVAGDSLYFSNAGALYRTDGSPGSVTLLHSGPVEALNAAPDRLYFTASSAGAGQELWTTQGTAETTAMVADLYPGEFGSRPFELTPLGDQLYFLADAGQDDLRLWSTDGTAAGTRMVQDLIPGTGVSAANAAAGATLRNMFRQGMPVMNAALGRVFFPADAGTSGLEPWSTDGTPGGAAPLGDLNRADGGSNPADFVAGPGNTFYFSATPAGGTKQVWVSDGTPANTRPLIDPGTGLMPVAGSPAAYLNGKLFVTSGGLWSTDGTAAGTRRLAQSATSPVVFNGAVYFVSHGNGNQLYRTDGTVEGTTEVQVNQFRDPQVFPDNPILYPTPLPTRLLFQRNFVGSGGSGMALFSTDGTSAGTVHLLTHTDQRQLGRAAVMGGKAYFPMNGAMWVTDGTPDGTRHVVDAPFISSITAAGDRLFFVSNGTLRVSDGTAQGTRQAGTTVPTPGTADEALMTPYGRNVVFESGGRAWISDGTPQGTRRLWDEPVVTLPASRATRPFAEWQGRLYFLVSRAGNRTALVRSDGTPEGTVAEADLPAVTSSAFTAPPNSTLHAVGDHLVAVLRDARFGREPFVVGRPQPLTTSVAARHVFYNGSAFDFDRTTPSAFDDDAIARDKRPALPGEVPTFANLTSYSRGINGIMVDVRGLPGTILDATDFAFRVAGATDPSTWQPPAAQPTVTVRRRAGVDGTDRVTLIWPDNTIRNAWLEVTLLATPRTHLAAPDTFVFGNLVGETGSTTGSTSRVDAADATHTRAARTTPGAMVSNTNRHDINRDGVVNVIDELLVRRNVGRSLPPPIPPSATVTGAPTPRTSTRRSAYEQLNE